MVRFTHPTGFRHSERQPFRHSERSPSVILSAAKNLGEVAAQPRFFAALRMTKKIPGRMARPGTSDQ